MRKSVVLWVALLAATSSGCMKVSDMAASARYQLGDVGLLDHSDTQRASSRRLQADSFVYIAQSPFSPRPEPEHPDLSGREPVPSTAVAEEAYRSFIEYFPRVRRAEAAVGLRAALAQARTAGAHYLLYARLAAADDRIGTREEWEEQESLSRLGVDSGVVHLQLIEVATGYPVDTVRIRPRGGLLSVYDTAPEDLIGPPLRQYARNLQGLN